MTFNASVATDFVQFINPASRRFVELGISDSDRSEASYGCEQVLLLAAESAFSPRIDKHRSLHAGRTNRRRQQHSSGHQIAKIRCRIDGNCNGIDSGESAGGKFGCKLQSFTLEPRDNGRRQLRGFSRHGMQLNRSTLLQENAD